VRAGRLAVVPAAEAARFTVVDRGLGRAALRAVDGRVVTVGSAEAVGLGPDVAGPATGFQWTENVYGDLILLSLATHRHLRIEPGTRALTADHPGPEPARNDGSCFEWSIVR
jgi:xylan 1,4-beta-xylosidase